MYTIIHCIELPRKVETAEMILRFLKFRVPCTPKLAYFSVNQVYINYQNNQLDVEVKNLVSNRHIFLEFWVVFTVSSFVGNPVGKPG